MRYFSKRYQINDQFLLNETKMKTFDYFYNNLKELPTIELKRDLCG